MGKFNEEKWLRILEDSSTFQGAVQRGRILERRETILWFGTDRFGPPSEQVSTLVNRISDLDQLCALALRVLHATGWDDLLRGV